MKNHLVTDLRKNHLENLLILTSLRFQNPVVLERDQMMKNPLKADLRKGLTENPLTEINLRFRNQDSEKDLQINLSLQRGEEMIPGKAAPIDPARHWDLPKDQNHLQEEKKVQLLKHQSRMMGLPD